VKENKYAWEGDQREGSHVCGPYRVEGSGVLVIEGAGGILRRIVFRLRGSPLLRLRFGLRLGLERKESRKEKKRKIRKIQKKLLKTIKNSKKKIQKNKKKKRFPKGEIKKKTKAAEGVVVVAQWPRNKKRETRDRKRERERNGDERDERVRR